jgi:hypothetical protein
MLGIPPVTPVSAGRRFPKLGASHFQKSQMELPLGVEGNGHPRIAGAVAYALPTARVSGVVLAAIAGGTIPPVAEPASGPTALVLLDATIADVAALGLRLGGLHEADHSEDSQEDQGSH